jgi:5-methylcytosine-specific restriction endonuclease McrA
MAFKNKEQYNAYNNAYMKARWVKRRLLAVAHLGSKCVRCGTTKNLEFDHIDPSTKLASIARASSWSEERFWKEVDKCQLLCVDCHKAKTKAENAPLSQRQRTAV